MTIKPCVRCGSTERYATGKCKACARALSKANYKKRKGITPTKPCVRCGKVDYYPSGSCRVCNRIYKRQYRKRSVKRADTNSAKIQYTIRKLDDWLNGAPISPKGLEELKNYLQSKP